MLFYRASIDLSRATLNYVAGLIRRRRKAISSTWRRLNPGQQALLVLVYLRKGGSPDDEDPQRHIDWADQLWAATRSRSVGAEVNHLADEGPEGHAPRLRRQLRPAGRDQVHVGPENVFRLNHNVPRPCDPGWLGISPATVINGKPAHQTATPLSCLVRTVVAVHLSTFPLVSRAVHAGDTARQHAYCARYWRIRPALTRASLSPSRTSAQVGPPTLRPGVRSSLPSSRGRRWSPLSRNRAVPPSASS